jgi:hypothetical protein
MEGFEVVVLSEAGNLMLSAKRDSRWSPGSLVLVGRRALLDALPPVAIVAKMEKAISPSLIWYFGAPAEGNKAGSKRRLHAPRGTNLTEPSATC